MYIISILKIYTFEVKQYLCDLAWKMSPSVKMLKTGWVAGLLLLPPAVAFHGMAVRSLPQVHMLTARPLMFAPTRGHVTRMGAAAALAPVGPALLIDKNTLAAIWAGLGSTPEPAGFATAALVNGVLFAPLYLTGKFDSMLTPAGVAHAAMLGTTLWATLGWQGWTLCVLYLLAGSKVTKVKMADKVALGIGEGRGGRRGPENVWGSAATGCLCALATVVWPAHRSLLILGYVSAMATKLSDTFQSEVGKAYGKNCFLITTLQRVPRGTEGAVSVEGYAAGVGGSLIIAVYAVAVQLMGWQR
jgi:uncharacterized protein (TIGR00297 family)